MRKPAPCIPYEKNRKVFRKLPEIVTFDTLIEELESISDLKVDLHSETLVSVAGKGVEFPIRLLCLGSREATAPCLFLVGGIHGLERIGTQVVLTCLDALIDRVKWDAATIQMLQQIRIVFVPIMNPIGIYHGTRANGSNVDLMRNAPVTAEQDAPFVMGGQKWSPHLPYYQGQKMEPELNCLSEQIEKYCFSSDMAISVDFHSGFGTVDQLWFPYAKTKDPFAGLPEIHALKTHFDESFPAHGYLVEPQALNYTSHGDLWDFLYDKHGTNRNDHSYLPLTLEMGSWYWILKNPIQILSRHGFFNPLNHRRHDEVLRSHLVLFDFLTKAVTSYKRWSRLSESERSTHGRYAKELWYGS